MALTGRSSEGGPILIQLAACQTWVLSSALQSELSLHPLLLLPILGPTSLLQASSSVALTPDGFTQAKYVGTYKLILKQRKGFIRLAHTTGATLVPVLGIGEPFIVGRASFGARALKLLSTYRPYPVKVVFGRPVVPEPAEGVAGTHARYMEELVALGKEHGVEVEIVE